jgi:YfiH family protein
MPALTISGFTWHEEPWGSALRCTAVERVAPHVFTTRQLRLRGEPDEEDGEWAAVARSVGASEPRRLVRLTQVHGRDVVTLARGAPRPAPGARPPADIVITDDPETPVGIQVADCVPLLLADPRTGAVAAAHAGWRGMVAGVPGAAVAALRGAFGCDPGDLVAAAGPSIGPCCYEVGPEVPEAFLEAGHEPAALRAWVHPAGRRDGGMMLDLWAATRALLEAAGVRASRIHQAALCTACHPDLCWSYRRDGAGTGRLAAAIRPVRPRPSPGWPGDRPPGSGHAGCA